jgi:hypothetical protein
MEIRNSRCALNPLTTPACVQCLDWQHERRGMLAGVRVRPDRGGAAAPDYVAVEAGLEAAGRRTETPERSRLQVPPPALEKPRHLAGEVSCLVSHVLKLVPVLAGIPLSLARHV